MRESLILIKKWFLLAIVMFISWLGGIGIASHILNINNINPNENQLLMMVMMFLVCLINTVVLIYPIMRSKWSGFKLIAVIFLQIFAIQFFVSIGLENLFFNEMIQIPFKTILMMNIGGLILASIFSPLAVLILGKLKDNNKLLNKKRDFKPAKFTFKFIILSVIVYPAIYFIFGYFIAWQFEGVRLLYSNSREILPFVPHMVDVLTNTYTYPFQIFRGMLWILILLPVIRMMKGSSWEKALVCGLLLAFIMNSQHLLPNQVFNNEIKLAHFMETASSNFIWGAIVGKVMDF